MCVIVIRCNDLTWLLIVKFVVLFINFLKFSVLILPSLQLIIKQLLTKLMNFYRVLLNCALMSP